MRRCATATAWHWSTWRTEDTDGMLGLDALPRTVLCLGAHSDDIEIGCGGTVRALVEARPDVHVHWVVFSGSGQRAEEARAGAARILDGARDARIELYTFRDGFFPWEGGRIKECFETLARSVDPDIVFTHYRDDRHQDHRTVSDLTWNTFRRHLVLEYEIPKYDGDLGRPGLYVPLTSEQRRHKIDTLMACFGSQRDHAWFTESTFDGLMRLRGIECAAPEGVAEAFHARKLSLGFGASGEGIGRR